MQVLSTPGLCCYTLHINCNFGILNVVKGQDLENISCLFPPNPTWMINKSILCFPTFLLLIHFSFLVYPNIKLVKLTMPLNLFNLALPVFSREKKSCVHSLESILLLLNYSPRIVIFTRNNHLIMGNGGKLLLLVSQASTRLSKHVPYGMALMSCVVR